jgi:hypothetical protein
MTEMVDDDTIYSDFAENMSDEEIAIVRKLMIIWADSMEALPENEKNTRILFCACINTIATMGPAYCRIAAMTLIHHAEQQEDII